MTHCVRLLDGERGDYVGSNRKPKHAVANCSQTVSLCCHLENINEERFCLLPHCFGLCYYCCSRALLLCVQWKIDIWQAVLICSVCVLLITLKFYVQLPVGLPVRIFWQRNIVDVCEMLLELERNTKHHNAHTNVSKHGIIGLPRSSRLSFLNQPITTRHTKLEFLDQSDRKIFTKVGLRFARLPQKYRCVGVLMTRCSGIKLALLHSTGWAKKRICLSVDNSAMVTSRKACDMSKVLECCRQKGPNLHSK